MAHLVAPPPGRPSPSARCTATCRPLLAPPPALSQAAAATESQQVEDLFEGLQQQTAPAAGGLLCADRGMPRPRGRGLLGGRRPLAPAGRALCKTQAPQTNTAMRAPGCAPHLSHGAPPLIVHVRRPAPLGPGQSPPAVWEQKPLSSVHLLRADPVQSWGGGPRAEGRGRVAHEGGGVGGQQRGGATVA